MSSHMEKLGEYQPEMMKILLEEGKNISNIYQHLYNLWEPTRSYINSHDKFNNAVRFLLENGVDPNATDKYGNTLLYFASHCGCIEVVKLFLEHGARIDAPNNDLTKSTPLYLAFSSRNAEMTKLLIQRGGKMRINQLWG